MGNSEKGDDKEKYLLELIEGDVLKMMNDLLCPSLDNSYSDSENNLEGYFGKCNYGLIFLSVANFERIRSYIRLIANSNNFEKEQYELITQSVIRLKNHKKQIESCYNRLKELFEKNSINFSLNEGRFMRTEYYLESSHIAYNGYMVVINGAIDIIENRVLK